MKLVHNNVDIKANYNTIIHEKPVKYFSEQYACFTQWYILFYVNYLIKQ